MSIPTISAASLAAKRQAQPVTLIDVRTPAEYEEVHAQGARSVPLDQLDPQVLAAEYPADETIYFICQSGSRGKQACERLLTTEIERVVNVEGGTQAWERAGLPVVRGRKTMSLERQVRIAAGTLVLLGTILGAFVHPAFLVLSGFVGAGLIFAGLTDTCGMGMLLAKLPWNRRGARIATRCILAVVLIPVAAEFVSAEDKPTGTIAGSVRFTGTVPPTKKVPTNDGGSIEHNDLVVDAKSKGLRWVMVVVEDAPAQAKLKDPEPAVIMDQKDMVFIPRMIAVQHGRQVRFENSDICNHSVRAYSTESANEMNVFVTPGQPVKKVFLPQKSSIKIGCTLHGWMTGWVFVVPHPWFAVTDEKGSFAIKDIPPGKYTIWFRHPDAGIHERKSVEVTGGQTIEANVVWPKTK